MKTKRSKVIRKKTTIKAGMKSLLKSSAKKTNSSSIKKSKTHTDFDNMEEMHDYYMKHNKDYRIKVFQYENKKEAYVDAPITEHDIAFEHTFDYDKAERNIKKKREEEFNKHHPHPKIIEYVHNGLLKDR